MTVERVTSNNPKDHAQKIEAYIYDLKNYCTDVAKKMTDAKAKELFETTADVLYGLETALSDFQSGDEEAWVKDEDRYPPI